MGIEWPPTSLYIVFAIVATWSSVLGAELRKDVMKPVELSGLTTLRKTLQFSGVVSAIHILLYLLLACYHILVHCMTVEQFARLISVILHIAIVFAVLFFMTRMFTISFKRTQ